MAQDPTRDLLDRLVKLEKKVRQLELRVRGKGGSKTYVIAFPITAGMPIPPIDLAVGAPDDTIPETLEVVGFRAKLEAGTCDISSTLAGTFVTGSDFTVTTTWGGVVLDTPVQIVDGDPWLVSIVADDSAAVNLTVSALLASRVS